MAEVRMQYVVAYDTPSDRRRYRLAKCLNDYGKRLQYSVFDACVTRLLFDMMVDEVRALIDAGADRVHVYPQCAACQACGRWSWERRQAEEASRHRDGIYSVASNRCRAISALEEGD